MDTAGIGGHGRVGGHGQGRWTQPGWVDTARVGGHGQGRWTRPGWVDTAGVGGPQTSGVVVQNI